MVASVRRVMPDIHVVQMTDMATEKITGVDEVRRKDYDGKLMTFRMAHLADVAENFITLDTDVIVQKDLRHVFDLSFDVALTKRTGAVMSANGVDLAKEMPYNTGVMFSKSRHFWKCTVEVLKELNPETHKWWGDQLSVRVVADSGIFSVKELPCEQFNYTPKSLHDRPDVSVIHYKGERKAWMIANGDTQAATHP